MPEGSNPEFDLSRPEMQMLHDITQVPRNRSLLSSRGGQTRYASDAIARDFHRQINRLDADQTAALYKASVYYLADEEHSTQDGRDALLSLFEFIATVTEDLNDRDATRSLLLEPIYHAFDALDEHTDPYGSFDSLMTVATVLAEHLRYVSTVPQRNNITNDITARIETFAATRTDPDEQAYIEQLSEGFVYSMKWGEPVTGEQGALAAERQKPDMNRAEERLHDAYLEIVAKQGSAKASLWEAVPDFRAACEARGFKLERFWNKHDPEQVQRILQAWHPDHAELKSMLLRKVQETRTAAVREDGTVHPVYADEVYTAANVLRQELTQNQVSITDTLARLQHLKNRDWKQPGARRAFEAQLEAMITTMGVEKTDEALDWEAVASYLNSRNTQRSDQIAHLSTVFGLEHINPRFTLGGRTAEDMYYANATGDCTAYHLRFGSNGHIVPVWLSMPNFTFALIHDDEGAMIAKAGLMLGLRNDQLCLVIDSVEASRLIPPAKTTLAGIQIDEGLTDIMHWGKEIGLDITYGHSFNNSSELMRQIEDRSRDVGLAESFIIFGGVDGILEYAAPLLEKSDTFRIYYQTALSAEDEGPEYLAREGTRRFETNIQWFMAEGDKEYLQPYLQSADWTELRRHYTKKTTGHVRSLLGLPDTTETYDALWAIALHPTDTTRETTDLFLEAYNIEPYKLIELDEEEEEFLSREGIAYRKSDLPSFQFEAQVQDLRFLAEIELELDSYGATPEQALRYLRGAIEIEAPEEAGLAVAGKASLPIRNPLPRIVEPDQI